MSVVKISAVTVAPEHHDEFARRYRTTPEQAPHARGFEGFDVLIPDDGGDRCLVITRWHSTEDFLAWTQSPDFAARHHSHREGESIETKSEMWSFAVVE